ncbi:MAG: glutathione S-transferase family protein [Hyphomonadaceae bacterium]|nr:glutathione S-transferase family protein [Hyphomonadaceae bacterium]
MRCLVAKSGETGIPAASTMGDDADTDEGQTMTLRLYMHPLASYCWKALVAFYEADVPFEQEIVDLGDPQQRANFLKLTPLGKFPVLVDEDAGKGFPESSIIIEYLAMKYPAAARLIPADRDLALRVRLSDRFYDLYIHEKMQRIVGDRLRPGDRKDPTGVEQARAELDAALTLVDRDMESGGWATGLTFTMADCAAAPALYYANEVAPFGEKHAAAGRYLERLKARPSFARVLAEAQPYFSMFPRS